MINSVAGEKGDSPFHDASNFERLFAPRTSLGSPRNFGKTRFGRFATFDFLTPKIFFRKIFRIFFFSQFFVIFGRFWRSLAFFDVKISFCIKFCFRYTLPEVCTTKNWRFVVLEHKEYPSSNARNVLLRTQGMLFSSNARNVLRRTQGMSFFERSVIL